MTFKITQLSDRIITIESDIRYYLAMLFVRYSEYYESSNSRFKGKKFTLIDFMEYYSLEFKKTGVFTYTKDWGGFNITGNTIKEVNDLGIDDFNKYDQQMLDIYNQYCTNKDAYIIGYMTNSNNTLAHELAHAFYYTDKEYRLKMLNLVSSLNQYSKLAIFENLRNLGYSDDVLIDETQAYTSTGGTSNKTITKDDIVKFETIYSEKLRSIDFHLNEDLLNEYGCLQVSDVPVIENSSKPQQEILTSVKVDV